MLCVQQNGVELLVLQVPEPWAQEPHHVIRTVDAWSVGDRFPGGPATKLQGGPDPRSGGPPDARDSLQRPGRRARHLGQGSVDVLEKGIGDVQGRRAACPTPHDQRQKLARRQCRRPEAPEALPRALGRRKRLDALQRRLSPPFRDTSCTSCRYRTGTGRSAPVQPWR